MYEMRTVMDANWLVEESELPKTARE